MRAPPGSTIGGLSSAERLRRILLLRRPDQHHQAAQQDAERDGGEHGGEHHLAGHLAHQEDIDQQPTARLSTSAAASAATGVLGEQRRDGQQQIGAEHHQLAMRQVEHAADPIDQHVAAGDQRVDRGQDDDVDEELHGGRCCRRPSHAVRSPSSPAKARRPVVHERLGAHGSRLRALAAARATGCRAFAGMTRRSTDHFTS